MKNILNTFVEIQTAKDLLTNNGYFVDNLWMVDDVKEKFECSDDEAQEILNKALQNEATMEQIWFAIDFYARELKLIPKEE